MRPEPPWAEITAPLLAFISRPGGALRSEIDDFAKAHPELRSQGRLINALAWLTVHRLAHSTVEPGAVRTGADVLLPSSVRWLPGPAPRRAAGVAEQGERKANVVDAFARRKARKIAA